MIVISCRKSMLSGTIHTTSERERDLLVWYFLGRTHTFLKLKRNVLVLIELCDKRARAKIEAVARKSKNTERGRTKQKNSTTLSTNQMIHFILILIKF